MRPTGVVLRVKLGAVVNGTIYTMPGPSKPPSAGDAADHGGLGNENGGAGNTDDGRNEGAASRRRFIDEPQARDAPWETTAQAMLWRGDELLVVGSDSQVHAECVRRGIAPVDLRGRVVFPGFVDAHTHFIHTAVKKTRPDLRGAKSRDEALRRLHDFLVAHPGSTPVIAEGWDESEWPDAQRPTAREADAVTREAAATTRDRSAADRPVVLRRICGHVAVAGTAATPALRARFGAGAVADAGLVLEAASLYMNEVFPVSPVALDRAVQDACGEAHRLGVTAVGDYSQAPYRAALQRAAAAGTLTVRVNSSIYVQQLASETAAGFRTGRRAAGPSDPHRPAPKVSHAGVAPPGIVPRADDGRSSAAGDPTQRMRDGMHATGGATQESGGSSPWMRDGGLKVFLDGSLGGHTARLREPYFDGPPPGALCTHEHPRGTAIWSDDEVEHHFAAAHAAGVQIHAHAIGDAAIDQGLEAFGRLAAHDDLEGHRWGNPLRHRFEHFEIAHDDQLARVAELGIVSSSQPNFVGEWSAKGGMYESRLGPRFFLNNRFRTMKQTGIEIAFGSDGMPSGALYGIDCAVHHPNTGQRLSALEAVWHYTERAAWSLHWEHEIGSLRPGMKADFAVLADTHLTRRPQEWTLMATATGGIVRSGSMQD